MSLQWIAGQQTDINSAQGADFLTVIKAIQNVSQGFQDTKKVSAQKISAALDKFIQEIQSLYATHPTVALAADQKMIFSQKELHHFFRRTTALLESPQKTRPPLGPCFIYGSQSSPLLRLLPVLSALQSGCTVVFLTQASSAPLYISFFERLIACGIPETALALLTTTDSEPLETLILHPSVRALHFQGHEYEGEFLKKIRLPLYEKKIKIHLGGKNPVIFTHDADLKDLKELLIAGYESNYLAEHRFNRWFVQEKNYSLFAEKIMSLDLELSEYFSQHPVSPFAESAAVKTQSESLLKEKNWKTLPHSQLPINFDFNNCSPWHQKEAIGSFLTITRFKNTAEVLKFANTTAYASACAVFAGTDEKAEEIARQLTMPHSFINSAPDIGTIDAPLGLVGCGFGNEISDQQFFNF